VKTRRPDLKVRPYETHPASPEDDREEKLFARLRG